MARPGKQNGAVFYVCFKIRIKIITISHYKETQKYKTTKIIALVCKEDVRNETYNKY